MMKLGLTKAVVGKVVAGAVVATMVTTVAWNGSTIIENAKTFVGGASAKLELYKANETTLVAGIKAKNTEIEQLKAKIAELEGQTSTTVEQLEELQAQVTRLEQEKSALALQLEGLEGENTELTGEVARLEGEINKANTEVASLQLELDKVSLESYTPATSEEIQALIGGTVAPPVTEEPEEEETVQTVEIVFGNGWTYEDERMNVYSAGIYKDSKITLYNKTEEPLTIKGMANDHEDMTLEVKGGATSTMDFTYRMSSFEILNAKGEVLLRGRK